MLAELLLQVDNTNYYLAVITAILAIITGYYARQTKKSVVALEESTKAQFKPFLKASLSMIGPVNLDLNVVNIGKGAAEDVEIKFRVLEAPNTERQWNQELMLPNEHQKFFIPISQSETEMSMQHFEKNQTTLEFEWKCKDILGLLHSGKKKIDVTNFIVQMNTTKAMYEESFEDKLLKAISEASKNIGQINSSLKEIHKDMPKVDENEKQPR